MSRGPAIVLAALFLVTPSAIAAPLDAALGPAENALAASAHLLDAAMQRPTGLDPASEQARLARDAAALAAFATPMRGPIDLAPDSTYMGPVSAAYPPTAAAIDLVLEAFALIIDVGSLARCYGSHDPASEAQRESLLAVAARLRNVTIEGIDTSSLDRSAASVSNWTRALPASTACSTSGEEASASLHFTPDRGYPGAAIRGFMRLPHNESTLLTSPGLGLRETIQLVNGTAGFNFTIPLDAPLETHDFFYGEPGARQRQTLDIFRIPTSMGVAGPPELRPEAEGIFEVTFSTALDHFPDGVEITGPRNTSALTRDGAARFPLTLGDSQPVHALTFAFAGTERLAPSSARIVVRTVPALAPEETASDPVPRTLLLAGAGVLSLVAIVWILARRPRSSQPRAKHAGKATVKGLVAIGNAPIVAGLVARVVWLWLALQRAGLASRSTTAREMGAFLNKRGIATDAWVEPFERERYAREPAPAGDIGSKAWLDDILAKLGRGRP